MKKIIVLLSILICFSCNNDDNGTSEPEIIEYEDGQFPENVLFGSWTVRTQSQLEEFGALNYTEITGTLKLDGALGELSDISDLTPLRSIEKIGGRLAIIDSPLITNLEGLHNVTSLGELFVQYCDGLVDFSSLRALQEITNNDPQIDGALWIRGNDALTSMDGLENVTDIQRITIANNSILQNLNGLSGLLSNEYMRTDIGCGSDPNEAPFCGNVSLTDFCGLQNLFTNGAYEFVLISGNGYNPSIQGIINGFCSSN